MINQQTLELFIYVDGINDIPFFSSNYETFITANGEIFMTSAGETFNVRVLNENIVIHAFTYNAQRMGSAPTISTTIKYSECLDELFNENVYALFNNERYFLSMTPSSSYSNEDIMYKHDATFVSERIALENIYFYDVVTNDEEVDKPISNNSEFSFFGDIVQFAERMNHSLSRTNLDYVVVVDEGITSEEKLLTIENKFFSEVLQEVYNTYDLPYYFVGKEIHIGYTTNAIGEVFRYGDTDALVSISKSNTNNRTINRVTGMGGEDNIPYYYPNVSPKGNIVAKAGDNNSGIFDENITITNLEKFSNALELGESVIFKEAASIIPSGYAEIQHTFNSYEGNFDVENIVKEFHFNNMGWEIKAIRGEVRTRYGGDYVFSHCQGAKISVTTHLNIKDRWWNWDQRDESLYDVPPTERDYFVVNIVEVTKDGVIKNDGFVQSLASNGDLIEFVVPDTLEYFYIDASARYNLYGWPTSGIRFSVGLNFESTPFWSRNGEVVSLKDIGLHVVGLPIDGDAITQVSNGYLKPQKHLMPPIYRESLGNERFYNAITDEYNIPNEYGGESGLKYEFENEYNGHNPKEQIVQFEEIKPSIKEVLNDQGLRIDMFSEFAYDKDDNDETFENENGAIEYRHPYFFAKLRKLDFNLFDHAIDDGEMTISMTSGHCGGCEFLIAVDENSKKNTVQVYLHDTIDENGIFHAAGTLQRDAQGNVLCGGITNVGSGVTEQDIQQDTINNEVWIALKKDKDTYGEIMPSKRDADNEIRPVACSSNTSNDGDTFVILNIQLPQSYVDAAEKKLEQQLIHFMWENNTEKFNFSIKFSRIFFAENPEILALLDENARIIVEYDDIQYTMYVSSLTYKATEDAVLPEITVELKDELSVSKNAIQKATAQVKEELYQTLYGIDVIAQGSQVFLRKDRPDTAGQPITFKEITKLEGGANLDKYLESKDYYSGVKGMSIRKDKNNNWHIETDYLHARKKFSAKEVEIQKVYHIGGAQIKSAASMVCTRVDDIGDAYRCWFDTVDDEGNVIYNQFVAGDQAYVQTFNLTDSDGNTTNHFYWRLVEAVDDSSIVLSKLDCAEGSTIPMAGDCIVQLGNRDEPSRQVAVIDAGAGEDAPYYRQFVGINTFALPEPETQLKPGDNRLTGKVDIKDGSLLTGTIVVKDDHDYPTVMVNGSNALSNNGRKIVIAAGVNDYDEHPNGEISWVDSKTTIYDDGTINVGGQVGLSAIENTGEEKVRIWAGANESNKHNAPFRVTQDGKVVAKNADIEGTVNANAGTFNNGVFKNVSVEGSISSPFQYFSGTMLYLVIKGELRMTSIYRLKDLDVKNNGTYFIAWGDEVGENIIYTRTITIEKGFDDFYELVEGTMVSIDKYEVDSLANAFVGSNGIDKYDNLIINKYNSSLDYAELDWSANSIGRLVRIVALDDLSPIVTLHAPGDKRFFENGAQLSKITLNCEIVELLGCCDSARRFLGWVVLNRKAIRASYPRGKDLSPLAYGRVQYNVSTQTASLVNCNTFNGQMPTIERMSNREYHLTVPEGWFNTILDCLVVCTVKNPFSYYSQYPPCSITATTNPEDRKIIFVLWAANGEIRDGEFDFILYPMNSWL